MGSDNKSGVIQAVPKVELCSLTPELKAEVAALVQSAFSQIHPGCDVPGVKSEPGAADDVSLSTHQDLTETERKYKDLLLSLEASYKETQDEHGSLSDLKIQLNLQRNKIVQLEKRVLKLTEAEESWKNTCARLRAENDDAEARAREAILSKDMLAAQNAQLSAQLAELQDVHALSAAQLDDAIYKNQQLESHISQLAKENIYWRQRAYPRAPTGAPTPGSVNDPGSQSNYPPNGPHFKGPPGRRHTAPNVCLAPPAPVCGEAPTNLDRPPKRSRTDSVDSSSSSSNGFRSRAPSESATTFALRPAKPEFVDPRRFPSTAPPPPPSNPHYPPWHVRVPSTQIPPTYSQAAPATIPYVATGHQVLPTMQAPAVPGKPAPGMFTPGPNHADAPANAPSSASQVRAEPSNSARMNQFIGQLFTLSSTGHPECRACKDYYGPNISSEMMVSSFNYPDLLAHAQKYHWTAVETTKTRNHQG